MGRQMINCVLAVLAVTLIMGSALADDAAIDRRNDTKIPAVTVEELEGALQLAGANRVELELALDHFQAGSMADEATEFLVANLPLSDLGSITGEMLINNVTLSMDAWIEAPYGRYIDPATWAHYVLPHRVSQEPLSDWRGYFHGELRDLVSNCKTPEEAYLVVGKWVGERVRFQQTQRRDQGPLITLKGGTGRCEEIMIVIVCACRSVGIPARNVYCPYWSWIDNNHAWEEVFASDGTWHFTGELDATAQGKSGHWVLTAARRASVVCAMCYGVPAELAGGVLAYKLEPGARYTQYNVIDAYRDTGTVRFHMPEAAFADANFNVFVHVFNFGALRRVARVMLDSDGYGVISLGAGTYLVSTDAPVDNPVALVRVDTGLCYAVEWADQPDAPADTVLVYPES